MTWGWIYWAWMMRPIKTIYKGKGKDYDYSGCINHEIQSYGFILSTLDKNYALRFHDWRPSYNWPNIANSNPLKEKVAFKINIKKGYKGAAYLANFDFAGFGEGSKENQVLIKRNCRFLIKMFI